MSRDAKSLAKSVAEGAMNIAAAISIMTGVNQAEIQRWLNQGEAALDLARQEQVARAHREIKAAMSARNW